LILPLAKQILLAPRREKNMGERFTVRNSGDGAEFRIEV
jgi:hypothetical protein